METNITVFETNKGNIFAKKNEFFAFFNANGELLREASAREWDWARGVMDKVSIDFDLDFSSLEEEKERKEKEAIKIFTSLTGLREELVKNFIAFTGAPVEAIKNAGTMMPEWVASAVTTRGSMWAEEVWVKAWAISIDGDCSEIESIVVEQNAGINGSGSSSDAVGFTAEYLAQACPSAKYFLINRGHNSWTDNGRGYDVSEGNCWEIFKAPNMNPIWEERHEAAILKFDNFLGEIKNLPNNNYHAIVSSIISDKDIIGAKTCAIDPNWQVEAVSTGGDMYSDQNSYLVWAVTSSGELQEIEEIIMTEDAAQSGRHYVNSYGYDYSHLKHAAPEAIFFLMKEEHHYWAEKSPSDDEVKWYILRPLSRKELMIKKINSKNTPMTLGEMFPGLENLK